MSFCHEVSGNLTIEHRLLSSCFSHLRRVRPLVTLPGVLNGDKIEGKDDRYSYLKFLVILQESLHDWAHLVVLLDNKRHVLALWYWQHMGLQRFVLCPGGRDGGLELFEALK